LRRLDRKGKKKKGKKEISTGSRGKKGRQIPPQKKTAKKESQATENKKRVKYIVVGIMLGSREGKIGSRGMGGREKPRGSRRDALSKPPDRNKKTWAKFGQKRKYPKGGNTWKKKKE